MDEQKSNSVETTRNRRQCLEVDFIVVQLHFAELQIHQTNFASALQHLRASQRALNDLEEFMEGFSSTQKMRKREIYYRSRQSNLDNILGNILALEAVTMMRHMPHYPEVCTDSILFQPLYYSKTRSFVTRTYVDY